MTPLLNHPFPNSGSEIVPHASNRVYEQTAYPRASLEGSAGSQTTLVNQSTLHSVDALLMFALIDTSGSMDGPCDNQTRLGVGKQSFKTAALLAARNTPNAKMGVIAFDHEARVIIEPVSIAQNSQVLCQSIDTMQASGGTRLDSALKQAALQFERNQDRTMRSDLILTDGHSGGDVEQAATRLHQLGVQVFVTAVGNQPSDVNEELLRSIASVVDGNTAYRFVSRAAGLTSTVLMQTKMATRQ